MAVIPRMGSEHPHCRSMYYLKYDLTVGTHICHLAVERKWHINEGFYKEVHSGIDSTSQSLNKL